LPVLGEACAALQFRCATGLNCDDDTTHSACAEIEGNGGPCLNWGDCYSNNCNANVCRPPPCQIVP
jgi:hypothetical protein